MSNAAINWAFEQRTGSPGERLVLFVLADAANKQGLAWPAQATIAVRAGLSDRHVRTAITALRKRELLTRIGHNRRRWVYHLNYASKPMFEEGVVGTPVPGSRRNPSSGDAERSRNPSSGVNPEIYGNCIGTPVPTNRKEPLGENPDLHFDRPSTIPRVSTDGRTDRQSQNNRLPLSGRMLARWIGRYVPRVARPDLNAVLGRTIQVGGTFVGAERVVRRYGARTVLGVILEMSMEIEGGGGYVDMCWRDGIKSPAEYLAWYLRENYE